MKKEIKIKICGMKDPGNIMATGELQPDFMGFIFYPDSPRFFGEITEEQEKILRRLPGKIRKTGVFVNEQLSTIVDIGKRLDLKVIQLHGEETPLVCKNLKQQGFEVIKTFKIDHDKIFSTDHYESVVDYFLFEKRGILPGGNNQTFDYSNLDELVIKKPFFLSGGISLSNYENTFSMNHKGPYGIDVNSAFENSPGIKNVERLSQLINQLRYASN